VYPHSVTNNVGGLKQFACMKAQGDIVVELDHDDYLSEDCLESLVAARKETNAGFFYSDWVEFRADGSSSLYDPSFGWENYTYTNPSGKLFRVTKAFEPSARSLCEIFYAPNHVRAWTREAYQAAGGYNTGMTVGDDHDLVCRTYLAGVEFCHISKPLYFYRLHDNNTVKLFNADIQKQQADNRNKYLHRLIFEECKRTKSTVLHLGKFVDPESWHMDFESLKSAGWQIAMETNSVGLVKADDFLQLIPTAEIKKVMEEIYRILKPGGWLLSTTPSTDGRGAFQDIRHSSYWNDNSWWYWSNKSASSHYYPKPDDATPKFQSVRVWTDFINDWHRQHNISFCHADMCAIKGQRQPGPKAGW
jgi:SAM-dependent methyltransferase